MSLLKAFSHHQRRERESAIQRSLSSRFDKSRCGVLARAQDVNENYSLAQILRGLMQIFEMLIREKRGAALASSAPTRDESEAIYQLRRNRRVPIHSALIK